MARDGRFNGHRLARAFRLQVDKRQATRGGERFIDVKCAEPVSLRGERRFANVSFPVNSGLVLPEAFKRPPPFGFRLFSRLDSFLEVSRPSAHGRLRRFGALTAFFLFGARGRAADAAYAATAASSSLRSRALKNRRTSAAAGSGRSRNALVETLTDPDILRKRASTAMVLTRRQTMRIGSC